MDTIQLAIIATVVVLILITIGYYLYQESKFKRLVENNFNQATQDVIIEENKAFTLDGTDASQQTTASILQKDIAVSQVELNNDPLFDMHEAASVPDVETNTHEEVTNLFEEDVQNNVNEEYPEYSVEAFFAQIHKIPFPFANEVNSNLDFIVDIGFEDVKKIKVLPEITQFTNKPFKFYILDKQDQWSVYKKGEKYLVRAIKLVVQLVDHEGIISQAQLSNIYNELHKFVMQNEGYIYKSDYESAITKIQNQIKHFDNLELNLNLFLITQESYSFNDFARFFSTVGLNDSNQTLVFCENQKPIFKITAENDTQFGSGKSYNMLQISASLHKQSDPNYAIEKIFDCAEKFMQSFESRLLTSNKRVLEQKDYDAIISHVRKYVENARQHNIKLGSDLINRLYTVN